MSLELTLSIAAAWSAAAFLLLAFLLSAVFLRGRAALAALVLLWAWCAFAVAAGTPPFEGWSVPRLEAVLLFAPLDLMLLACVVETVLISRIGAIVAALLITQTLLALHLPAACWDLVWQWERLPARWLGEAFAARGLPPPGVSAFAGLATAAVSAFRGWRDDDVVLTGVAIAALVAGWLGYGLLLGFASALPLMIGGLALLAAPGWASFRMAFLDALTGLPGRRVLDERMARLGRRWSVAMIDVDHFKKFNDAHGHDVGDQVLKMVASKLRRHFGANAYRYGGEEFSVLFPGGAERDAFARCERFREDVAGHEMVLRAADRPARPPGGGRGSKPAKASGAAGGKARSRKGMGKGVGKADAKGKGKGTGKQSARARGSKAAVSVTVSVGIARRTGARRRPEVVLKAADVALYRAKDAGRDRVMDHDA